MPWAAPAARGDPPAYADLQAAGLLDPGPTAGPAARGSVAPNTTDAVIIPCLLGFPYFNCLLCLLFCFFIIRTNEVKKLINIQ